MNRAVLQIADSPVYLYDLLFKNSFQISNR